MKNPLNTIPCQDCFKNCGAWEKGQCCRICKAHGNDDLCYACHIGSKEGVKRNGTFD